MDIPEDAMRLRVHIGESDMWKHQALHEAIVLKAKQAGLAGATVFRSPMGFGASSKLRTAKILQLSSDLPVIVEMVDSEEKLLGFLPCLKEMLNGGLVTLEKVKVLHYLPKSD